MLAVLKPLFPVVSKFLDDDWNSQNNWSQSPDSTDHKIFLPSKLSIAVSSTRLALRI